jgi:hypothetical protein
VCGPAGKCVAGTPTAASVAITGVDGHAAADYLSGTVRVLVSARATSGVGSVRLASGSVNFPASTLAAAAPLYAFDVDTTALTDGDATLTATLTAGDNSAATATGTLHVDNAKPVITTFTASGSSSTTITAGTTALLSVSFTPATASATITSGSGSITLSSSGSALVSPDVMTTFTLRVTSRSGVTVQSGTTGQPPDVTVSVVSPASMTGNFTVSPSVITSLDSNVTITFALPSLSTSVTAASIRDDSNTVVVANALIPANLTIAKPASSKIYTLLAQNAAGATATATTSVTVRGAADALNTTLLASAASVTVGGSITLTPTIPAAYTGSISGPGLSSPLVVTTGQPYPVTIPAAGTNAYTLKVQNDATPVATFTTPATNVSGVAVPVIATFTASAPTVTNGNTVTFTYNVTGGDCVAVPARCRITGPTFSFDILGTNDGSNQVTTATPPSSSTSTYVLTLVNSTGTAAGTVSRSMSVQAVAPATASLVASATEVAKGSTVTLTPTFSGASSYIADDAGVHVVDNPTSGVATAPITVSRTNTYTLVALNAAGASATDSVTVTALNTIAQTGNATTARFGATATQLNNGRVLIAGGGTTAGGNGTNSAELYDQITRTYSSTSGNLVATGRRGHTAHLLTDGRVLLVGGYDSSGSPLRSLEAYDPGAGTFSPYAITGGTSGGMVNPRALHTSTVLADGTLLVAGGCGTATCDTTVPDARATAEIIDLVAGSTAATTPMNAPHVGATGTLLGSGKMLIAGGATSAGGNGTNFAEIFSAGTFTCPGTDCTINRNAMVTTRNGHGALLLPNGQVALFGGKTNAGAMTATIELFDPAGNGTFATNAASLGTARWLLQATQLGGAGRILISGGFTTGTTTASTVLNLFAVSGSTLTAVTGIDSLTTARGGHTATLLFGGAALMSGGTSSAASGELFSSAQ